LSEIQSLGIKISILAVQPKNIPTEVKIGLSSEVEGAIKKASEIIKQRYLEAPNA
jgi:Ni,Fe-hydrogenase maturation factor